MAQRGRAGPGGTENDGIAQARDESRDLTAAPLHLEGRADSRHPPGKPSQGLRFRYTLGRVATTIRGLPAAAAFALQGRLGQQTLVDSLLDPRLEKTVSDYFAALSAADAGAWFALFADDAISHDPVGAPEAVGRDGLAEIWTGRTAPFAELATTVDSVFHAGTGAAAKWSAEGTSREGGKVSFGGITIFEFTDGGLIQTVMVYWDPAAMLIALADSAPNAG